MILALLGGSARGQIVYFKTLHIALEVYIYTTKSICLFVES